jgi:hypothetical protein
LGVCPGPQKCCTSGPCNTTICVTGCNGFALPGASVTVKNGSTVVASGTTGSPLGCVLLNVVTAGSYTVVVSYSGFATSTSVLSLTCGGTVTISLSAASGYACSPGCERNAGCDIYPVPDVLTFSCSWGTTSLTKTLLSGGGTIFSGCLLAPVNACCWESVGCTPGTLSATAQSFNAPIAIQFYCCVVSPVSVWCLNFYPLVCGVSPNTYSCSADCSALVLPASVSGGTAIYGPLTSCNPFDWSITVTPGGCGGGVCATLTPCDANTAKACDWAGCGPVTYTVTA